LNKQIVKSCIDSLINGASIFLAILNCFINQSGIFGFLASGKNEGGIGGSVLWLVFIDSSEITRVANNGLYNCALVMEKLQAKEAKRL
jgi:hypothetical protein